MPTQIRLGKPPVPVLEEPVAVVAAPAAVETIYDMPAATTRARRIPWTLLMVAALLILGAAVSFLLWRKWTAAGPAENIQLYSIVPRSFPVLVREKGEIKAAKSIELRSEIEGRTTIISLVEEGIQAKKGDLLVELASDQIDTNIRDAEIREATARANFEAAGKELEILRDDNASKVRKAELALRLAELEKEKYNEGDAQELRQKAKLAKEKAEYVLRRAEETLKDSEQLHTQGFLTKIELDNDRFSHYEGQLQLAEAKLSEQVLEKYTIPMAVQEKDSEVAEAKKELERTLKAAAASEAKAVADLAGKKSEMELVQEKLGKLREQKTKSKIHAPADGLVVYARENGWWRNDSGIEKGAQVYERQSLIELPDISSMKAIIRIHEAQTEKLKLDLPATVDIEGFSDRQYTGKVSKIAVLADSQNRFLNPNLKQYETEVLLDGSFTDLKPGLTARVEIMVSRVENALAVPVQAVFGKAGKYYVFVEQDGKPQAVPIEAGQSSSEYLEVKKGLSEGDKIYLAVTSEMKLLLPTEEETNPAQIAGPPPGQKP